MGNRRLCIIIAVMKKIRLIASDLDGTLLRDGAQQLRPETCGLIKALHEKNIAFLPSSGRQFDNLTRLFEPVRNEIAYLCQNGASAWADGHILFQETMDQNAAERLIEEVLKRSNLELMVNDVSCCYVLYQNDAFYHLVNDVVGMRAEKVQDLHPYAGACTKISLYKEDGNFDLEYWQKQYGEWFTVVPGGVQWLDIMAAHINKGTAFQKVLNYLNVKPEETLVFGDNLNDLEIMKLAGVSATVPGGVPRIQEIADVRCDTVEKMLEEILHGKDRIEDWKGNGK